jgi:adenylate kinase family enzyme
MFMNPKTFILFGPAGCGKGTQSEQLSQYLKKTSSDKKVVYVETGAQLREFVKGKGHTREMIRDVMAKGGLLPEFIPIWIWTGILIETLSATDHLVLDGLCRRPYEAPVLDGALQFYQREKPFVIVLNVSNTECKRRLLGRNRHDDKAEEIEKRLAWYKKDVVPTLDFFRKNNYYTVFDINGEQSIEKVHADIVAAIA